MLIVFFTLFTLSVMTAYDNSQFLRILRNDPTVQKCYLCNKNYNNTSMKAHFFHEHRCTIAQIVAGWEKKEWKRTGQLFSYKIYNGEEIKVFQCMLCNKFYVTQDTLRGHLCGKLHKKALTLVDEPISNKNELNFILNDEELAILKEHDITFILDQDNTHIL